LAGAAFAGPAVADVRLAGPTFAGAPFAAAGFVGADFTGVGRAGTVLAAVTFAALTFAALTFAALTLAALTFAAPALAAVTLGAGTFVAFALAAVTFAVEGVTLADVSFGVTEPGLAGTVLVGVELATAAPPEGGAAGVVRAHGVGCVLRTVVTARGFPVDLSVFDAIAFNLSATLCLRDAEPSADELVARARLGNLAMTLQGVRGAAE
jgi:hypothetical protein